MTGNNDKAMELMRESEAEGLRFLPPSIKHSKYMYTVEKGSIRIGLGAIKGVTPTFYDAIKQCKEIWW